MLTSEERIRAMLNNIRSWSWEIYPKFTIEREDAEAIRDYFRQDKNFAGAFYDEKGIDT